MSSGGFFKKLRIIFLLFVLLMVGGDYWLTKLRTTDWDLPLQMVIYPINGDNSEAVSNYIDVLTKSDYEPIEIFMQDEAAEYQLKLTEPVEIVLGPEVNRWPPKPPANRNVLSIIWWSLKMRYWAYRVDNYQGPASDIRMFVVYYDPAVHDKLNHSLGLEKGLIGVVNAFADKKLEAKNNVIITHELLHTVGATDKYQLETGEPIYPIGFAAPDQQPLYPQEYAEIMAGMIPIARDRWEMPTGLNKTLIGPGTAKEINWVKAN